MSFNTKVTPQIEELAKECNENTQIPKEFYTKYDVKKGLRDINGQGVRAGLTNISNIVSWEMVNGVKTPCPGRLYYRGININDLVKGFTSENRFGFDETCYLLLFGKLPTQTELNGFSAMLTNQRELPKNFVRDVIMKASSKDMMNTLARGVLTLYYYDDNADDISLPNVLRQCTNLIAIFPMLAVYSYQAYDYYQNDESLFIHKPLKGLSAAENILYMLRPDKQYTALEAKVLDICLVLHMEHGGGNNSTFTTHVVTSSGTDTYATIAAALGSLKGPKHGGANIKVMRMFDDLRENVKDTSDPEEVEVYLRKLLHGEAFDHKGLIYGMGHAVYSVSDPRAVILKSFVQKLAKEKGREDDWKMYSLVEELAPKVIADERHIYKGVSANVDFYSGFVYSMLGLPVELYTPIFACARIVGWSAHRLEELINVDKIIRPAYMNICPTKEYIPIHDRK
ncbi:MAG: citrate/2-methylcitrate synthase [Eubacteriales bacterium]|jgi:citrate synthase